MIPTNSSAARRYNLTEKVPPLRRTATDHHELVLASDVRRRGDHVLTLANRRLAALQRALVDESQEGDDVRRNSSFAGLLSEPGRLPMLREGGWVRLDRLVPAPRGLAYHRALAGAFELDPPQGLAEVGEASRVTRSSVVVDRVVSRRKGATVASPLTEVARPASRGGDPDSDHSRSRRSYRGP